MSKIWNRGQAPLKALAMLTIATALAGCGPRGPATAAGIRGAVAGDAATACGLARADQQAIDKTVESLVGADIIDRPRTEPNCEERRRRERKDGTFGGLSS